MLASRIIALHNDPYWTAEQCHSELKTDLDIKHLTPGKFATNALMLAPAGLA